MTIRFPPDAILLAAGLGTRLRPLTGTRPKPLVAVAGQPLIERVVAPLAGEGLTRFAVNAHYLADQMAAAVDALPLRFPGCRFSLSREDEVMLGTGGGARAALPLIETDPVLVANTDAFWRPADDRPLARMAARFDADPDSVVLLCAHPACALGFRRSHDFCLDPKSAITKDSGLPVIYAGVVLLGRVWFAGRPDGPFSMNRIFEAALEQDRLRGVLLDAEWFHIGDPEARDAAERRLREA
ncbi:MAG: nucleotidyltransferase family protein [Alphaproteobacteria bacterium]|nr:nucleotidyltransferase family protein [Alphaproteobacteria bacterium]